MSNISAFHADYCSKLDWYLVPIPAGSKGPTHSRWQHPERALSDANAVTKFYEQYPTHNVGLLHGALGAETTEFLQGSETAAQALADVEAAYTAAAKEKGFLQ